MILNLLKSNQSKTYNCNHQISLKGDNLIMKEKENLFIKITQSNEEKEKYNDLEEREKERPSIFIHTDTQVDGEEEQDALDAEMIEKEYITKSKEYIDKFKSYKDDMLDIIYNKSDLHLKIDDETINKIGDKIVEIFEKVEEIKRKG